jgi:hypothetical protein
MSATTHYVWKVLFDPADPLSYWVFPKCISVDLDLPDEVFDLVFGNSQDALEFLIDEGIIAEALENKWTLIKVVETPIDTIDNAYADYTKKHKNC